MNTMAQFTPPPPGDFLTETLNALNSNKYIFAILMLILNMGARYLELDLADHHKQFLSSRVIRRLVIFTIVFIATRDIIVSLLVTAAFIIIVLNLFNTESEYCILPDYLKQYDTNGDGKLSPSEIVNAGQNIKQNNLSSGIPSSVHSSVPSSVPSGVSSGVSYGVSSGVSSSVQSGVSQVDNSAEKKNLYLSFLQR